MADDEPIQEEALPDPDQPVEQEAGWPEPDVFGSPGSDNTEAEPAAPEPAPVSPPGLLEPGNIDLHDRPTVKNPDGSISTVRSASFRIDDKEVLLPTIRKGLDRPMTAKESVGHYRNTGEHLGKFDTPDHAEAYAQQLHLDQEQEYAPQQRTPPPPEPRVNLPSQEPRVDLPEIKPGFSSLTELAEAEPKRDARREAVEDRAAERAADRKQRLGQLPEIEATAGSPGLPQEPSGDLKEALAAIEQRLASIEELLRENGKGGYDY